jgi:hypothetical protein
LLFTTSPAERALEFAREEHTAGMFGHTPAHLGRDKGERGCPDAVAAVALALAATAPAESALEFAREEHTAGPWEHTPQHLYDVDDPNFGYVGWSCSGGGDWGDCDYGSS